MSAPLTTYRDVTAYLRQIGAVHLRTRGTHEAWKLPNGHRVTVPVPAGTAGRKAWDGPKTLKRWQELQVALRRGPLDTAWGRGTARDPGR